MGVTQSFLYQVRRMSLWDSVNRLESRTGVTNPSESPRVFINKPPGMAMLDARYET